MKNIFLAIHIPKSITSHWIRLVHKSYPDWTHHPHLNWAAVENIHMTLHFFGPLEIHKLDGFRNDLPHYLKYYKKFTLSSLQLFNFPKPKSDLLAAYVELSNDLAKLYQTLQTAVQEHGFPTENRPYLPHITLCRSRRPKLLKMQPIVIKDSIEVHELVLLQSQSTPEGSQYIPIDKWFLGA